MDACEVNQTADLAALVERDTRLHRVGASWCGPCPFCGGTDRFVLKQTPGGWRWFCRGCGDGKYHGPIDYVMRRDRLDFRAALAALGGTLEAAARPTPSAPPPPPERPRPDHLQAVWGRTLEACERALWGPGGAAARDFLHRRGLTDATLRAFRVGFHPGGEVAGRWLAAGIVLPWLAGGYIAKLRVRLLAPKVPKDKYRMAKADGADTTGLFGADNCRGKATVFLVEGEFDAMLLQQEAGDALKVGVATLGSASARPSPTFWGLFGLNLVGRRLRIAYDTDRAGTEGAQVWLNLIRAQRVEVPQLTSEVKDITDYYLAGGDLRAWAAAARGAAAPPAPVTTARPPSVSDAFTPEHEPPSLTHAPFSEDWPTCPDPIRVLDIWQPGQDLRLRLAAYLETHGLGYSWIDLKGDGPIYPVTLWRAWWADPQQGLGDVGPRKVGLDFSGLTVQKS